MLTVSIVAAVLLLVSLLYAGHGYWAWVLCGAVLLAAFGVAGAATGAWMAAAAIFVAAALLFGVRGVRRQIVTRPLMPLFAAALPKLSETERAALEAGTVWWDGDLFSGRPDWRKLIEFSVPGLSEREQAFVEGPLQRLCEMLDDWQVKQRRELPPEIWKFLKEERFFGMIIPEEYGGLGFSARAHSGVIVKLSSRSIAAAVTVMVPNSLGPGELLLQYGTEEQKRYYLPRLARGDEVPCLGLTEPEAGSDAAAAQSEGVVCYGTFEGEEVLGMRLNWEKRYITLGPVSTLLGLAFRLRDPDRLLGGEGDLGITCALIPTDLPGVEIGQRHDPLGVPFANGPNAGKDVFVPLERIIGGQAMAGQGWRMLMESLAAGRSISLPSLSVGAAQLSTRIAGAYATVREQFGLPIGRFEGIEEPLARIGGMTYLMDAAGTLTAGAVDSGEKPAVISAIVKCYLTEGMRGVVNDAMDILAGAGICRGPRNVLERVYASLPIGITVEGANILTRSMIVFGQGAIRSHPFVLEEIQAARTGDFARFDRAFFGHVNLIFSNALRAPLLALTGGWPAARPVRGPLRREAARITRISAAFSLLSDVSMALLGGGLKRREKLTGRLADVLAWMYLASAVIKRFHDEGQTLRDLPYARWACRHAHHQMQRALLEILYNFPTRPVAWVLRLLLFPLGARMRPPDDALGGAVAQGLLEGGEARLHLTQEVFIPSPDEPGLGRLEAALEKVVQARGAEAKLRSALREGRLEAADGHPLLEQALSAGVLTAAEAELVRAANALRNEVIQVDAFPPEEYLQLRG